MLCFEWKGGNDNSYTHPNFDIYAALQNVAMVAGINANSDI